MNDNEGRHAPAANSYITGPETSTGSGRRMRAAILRAVEAFEDGDLGFAVTILLGALEDDGPTERRFPCRVCGLRFEWPGLVDHHERFAHH